MTMLSDNWAEALEPGLRGIFTQAMSDYKSFPDYVRKIFTVESSKRAFEEYLGVGGTGTMDEWDNSIGVSYEDTEKGFNPSFRHKKYSKGKKIERELYDDNMYGEIKSRILTLADSVYFTRQKHGAGVFNNAFSNSVLGVDEKPLCSTAHPKMPGSSNTFSNAGTYELTAENVENVRTAMMAWTDDKGNEILALPDTLIVPTALRKTAIIIAETKEEPFQSDYGVNIWRGNLKVVENPFLTDTNAWFMTSSGRQKRDLLWFDRRKPDFANEKTFDTEVAKYKVVARFSYGWKTPYFVYGCNPS